MQCLQGIIHPDKSRTGHISVVRRQGVNKEQFYPPVIESFNEFMAVMVGAPKGNEQHIRTSTRSSAVNRYTVNCQ